MSSSYGSDGVPIEIRDECMARFREGMSHISGLIAEGTSEAVKVAAWDKFGKFGMAGRKSILIENQCLGLEYMRLAKEIFDPPEEQMRRFVNRIEEFVKRLEGEPVDEESEGDD